MQRFTAAVAQAAPVSFDVPRTLDKLRALSADAAGTGARLAAPSWISTPWATMPAGRVPLRVDGRARASVAVESADARAGEPAPSARGPVEGR